MIVGEDIAIRIEDDTGADALGIVRLHVDGDDGRQALRGDGGRKRGVLGGGIDRDGLTGVRHGCDGGGPVEEATEVQRRHHARSAQDTANQTEHEGLEADARLLRLRCASASPRTRGGRHLARRLLARRLLRGGLLVVRLGRRYRRNLLRRLSTRIDRTLVVSWHDRSPFYICDRSRISLVTVVPYRTTLPSFNVHESQSRNNACRSLKTIQPGRRSRHAPPHARLGTRAPAHTQSGLRARALARPGTRSLAPAPSLARGLAPSPAPARHSARPQKKTRPKRTRPDATQYRPTP